jgi:hypothetical protein
MPNMPTTLAELFRSEGQESIDHQDLLTQTRDDLGVDVEGMSDGGWAMIKEEVGNSLDQLLDIGIADILGGAWTKLGELQEYRDIQRHPPRETSMVPLHRHRIRSSHKPKIRLYAGDTEIAAVEFVVEALFEILAANIKIRGGRIIEITSGEYGMSGKISLAGQTLVEHASRTYQLPGHISLGEGFEIPAL